MLVEKAPAAQVVDLIATLVEMSREAAYLPWKSVSVAKIPADKRKDVVRQLTGLLAQRDVSAIGLAVAISDDLPAEEREKLHGFLLKKLVEIGDDPKSLRGDEFQARQGVVGALSRSKHLSPDRVHQLLAEMDWA